MIDLSDLNNLEKDIRKCARDLHLLLPEDAGHLPEDLKKCFDPWVTDHSMLEKYIKFKNIQQKLFDISAELCDIRDDLLYEDIK